MNPFLIRNVAGNAAKQRQLDAVQSAAEQLARAITNAVAPDPSKLAEIKTAITNEYERCRNLRTPTTNGRGNRDFLLPSGDDERPRVPPERGAPVNNAGRGRDYSAFILPDDDDDRAPVFNGRNRAHLAPQGE